MRHFRKSSQSLLRESVADQLHDAGSILVDRDREGIAVRDKFQGEKAGRLQFYAICGKFPALTFWRPK
ncbi:MAG: hypothetical protein HC849_05740 [Oscillatoriales cyanobacterium RU_3_3]|nr:hypothetical protein [Microcoleus sp. SM1_3_4]NJM59803.1 hypothetical protein [Oscillatoriales cyanobacterium RU_3_3]